MSVMPEVEFHTGVQDPLGFACRLLRKACRQGARVLVTAPSDTLTALDRSLWTFEECDFLPHVRLPGAAPATAALTPIWLAASATVAQALAPRPGVLVNLGAAAPPEPAQWPRLIEIVGAEADAAAGGRERWRAYKAAGLSIVHHAASARD
ncbi:DNA polymerase III subunit chi [Rubrivivax sp. A210]|uniref:DNA polymerase III subunit chi n=1 Tax=Rubrivivax sp. A210 TaxID=2772301 RepID=UPI0019B21AAE|nr:DNA polymerase III subunit chi [Rubrivivax sp. A210]CAD5373749.1 DNA polymerase III subunit chi [Rubrivivax sp. A210]